MEFLFIFYYLFGYIIVTFIDYDMNDKVCIRDLLINLTVAFIWPIWFVTWFIVYFDHSKILNYSVIKRKQIF